MAAGASPITTFSSHNIPLFLLIGSTRRQQLWQCAPVCSSLLLLRGRTSWPPRARQFANIQLWCGHKAHVVKAFQQDGGGISKADAGESDEEERNGLTALQQLDSQLQMLSQPNPQSSSTNGGAPEEVNLVKDTSTPMWPEFSDGFLVYAGVMLLVLTVINNVLFRIFFEPPAKPKMSPTISSELRMLKMRELSRRNEAPPIGYNSQ